MDRIQTVMKCVLCHETLESPVILPCNCNICYKHVKNRINDFIQCEKCGVVHRIPTNGFHANKALQVIIETEIANLDFGIVHKEAKKSCESVENTLKEFELLIKDPYFYTYERISELKNSVQLKGDELKLRIDQEMKKLFDNLEENQRQSKEYFSSNEFKEESKKLETELKLSQSNLNSWLDSLNRIKIDEEKWKGINEESEYELKCINEKLEMFKNKLLLNKFHENQKHVNWFKSIKIDSLFKYVPLHTRCFLGSKIITKSLNQKLEELLKQRNLNGRKWSLLYQGSRDGFRASDFHSYCDNKPNTLTIVKSTNGNIFGGFTSAQWKSTASYVNDNKAFIFSLINQEDRPLIFKHTDNSQNSIYMSSALGPTFGFGHDFVIYDSSNTITSNYSSLGNTYTHPDYACGSEKANTILAGSYNFKVEELEVVFQMQQ